MKRKHDERSATPREMRRVCRCGETFGRHGAAPPHTIGDSCDGFVEKTTTKGAER